VAATADAVAFGIVGRAARRVAWGRRGAADLPGRLLLAAGV